MKKEQNILLEFGRSLKGFRQTKRLSQEQLATSAGLHPTYISQVERGKRNLTLMSLYKICLALNCSLSELLQDLD